MSPPGYRNQTSCRGVTIMKNSIAELDGEIAMAIARPTTFSILLLSLATVSQAADEQIDVRTFDGSDPSRVLACKAATDAASKWARDSNNRVFSVTSTTVGECDCEKVEPTPSTSEAVAIVEKAYGLNEPHYACIVRLEIRSRSE